MKVDRTKLKTPFYANIFSYIASNNREGYEKMDEATMTEVANLPGFLGYEAVGDEKRRIFISYWQNMHAIENWRRNKTHKDAKSMGKEWYSAYHSMLVKIEHQSQWNPDLLY